MFRTRLSWIVLPLWLAGCHPPPTEPASPAASASVAAAPAHASTASMKQPAWRWTAGHGGQGTSAQLQGPSGVLMRITCSANPQRLTVTVPAFAPIGSEDRLSFGFDDAPMALAADLQASGQGVSAHGPIPADIEKKLRDAHTVSARYGNQIAGPFPAPAGEAAHHLAHACAEMVTADPSILAERPATADSAQAAATVVERYLGLLATGDTEAADQLWGAAARADGSAVRLRERLSHYSDLHGEVYAPGRVEGAAGSLYITVPARITGRRTDGSRVQQPVTVTLRRVNDVPGSTQVQRRWHIEKVTLDESDG